jgi:glycosyltransferase involved in cell wall biosynthesis
MADRGNVERIRDRQSNRKLAVAHFMPWSGIGGVEIATLRLVDATKEQFHHIAFCLIDAVALIASFKKLGIETVVYSPPEPSLRHAMQFYKASTSVARQIRQAGVDIVHFSDEKAAYHNSFAALLSRSRTICHLRVSYPYLSLRHRLCLIPVQSFIFVSKEAKESFGMSLPSRKVRVIYDAVEVPTGDMVASNADVRREFGIPDASTLIGMVARVSPQKDYFTLASAAAEVLLKYPDARFLIVGDNSLVALNRDHYGKVFQKLNELGIAEKFIFTGHRSDVTRLIAAMEICVLCTHREGFPLSILETMAMRKPVVATAVGGIPEIVDTGLTGYLHQHENSNELATTIMHLIENPEKANQIGLAAFNLVREHYSRQKFSEEISRAYADVMSQ